jgi:hypothetical protein
MAIDLRAKTYCSLGDLISASINDDYIPGSGLVKTTGSCEINGVIKPDPGTAVTFFYEKFGFTRQVPRQLKVLSSFANPFTGITSVELGCQLTYMQDVKEETPLDVLLDPENEGLTQDDQKIVILPISASFVAKTCLEKINLAGDPPPLTNKFSLEKFDLSGGYVSALNDLLLSESYCGYVGPDGTFQYFSLQDPTGSSRIIDQTEIIDVAPVNIGELPGNPVVVKYGTLKLKNPESENEEDNLKKNWELEIEEGFPTDLFLEGEYLPPRNGEWINGYTYTPKTTTRSTYDSWDRLVKRTTVESTILAEANPSYVTAVINKTGNGPFGNTKIFRRTETEIFYKKQAPPISESGLINAGIEKEEGYDEVLKEVTTTYEPTAISLGGMASNYYDEVNGRLVTLGVNRYTEENGYFQSSGSNNSEGITQINETTYETYSRDLIVTARGTRKTIGNLPMTKTVTKSSRSFGQTPRGQQYIAEKTEKGFMIDEIAGAVLRLVDAGGSIRSFSGREAVFQGRPSAAERAASNLAEGEDPNNGFKTDSSAEVEVIFTEEQTQRRVEFDMPYAPDDTFTKIGSGSSATYEAQSSDAPQKAKLYGLTQNKLLLGLRYGIGIQVPPEVLPTAPFSPVVIQAKGLTALYATNAMSWVIDNTGIIASIDAIYIGVVGKS